jgi:hypothetical protein
MGVHHVALRHHLQEFQLDVERRLADGMGLSLILCDVPIRPTRAARREPLYATKKTKSGSLPVIVAGITSRTGRIHATIDWGLL